MTRAELLANLRKIRQWSLHNYGEDDSYVATIDEAIRVIESECAPRGSLNDVQGIRT